MATKQQVIDLHKKHPDWTCGRIATALDYKPEYVAMTFRRNGLYLPNSRGYKPLPKSTYVPVRESCARLAEAMGSPEIAKAIRSMR